jgi:hypothetical protein
MLAVMRNRELFTRRKVALSELASRRDFCLRKWRLAEQRFQSPIRGLSSRLFASMCLTHKKLPLASNSSQTLLFVQALEPP